MKVLRLPEVIAATGLSRMTVYRLEAREEFPKRRRLGRNSVGWLEEEVAAWIQSRPAATQACAPMRLFNALPRVYWCAAPSGGLRLGGAATTSAT
jgi:prophage regulatory protein